MTLKYIFSASSFGLNNGRDGPTLFILKKDIHLVFGGQPLHCRAARHITEEQEQQVQWDLATP